MSAVGCGGSGSTGCSCAKPIPGGFPAQYKIKNAAQLKVTRKGFDFVQNNANALIASLLPTGLEFDVPKSGGDTQICTNGNCKIKLNIRRLQIDMKPKDKLGIGIWLDITSTKIGVKVKTKVIGIPVSKSCDLYVTSKNKSIKADATVSIDPRNDGLGIKLGTPSISLSNGDFKISGDIICKAADLFKGLFKGLIEKEVKKALQDVLDGFTCMTCKSNADCPSGAACTKGQCVQGGSCLPMEVGFSGAVDLKELLGGLGNPTAKDLWFGINLGGRAEVKTSGLELGMLGGTHSAAHPCVAPRKFPAIPAPALFNFPANAPDGQGYAMGAAISQAMMTKASQSLYSNGALCIRIDSSISPDLGAAFSVKNLGALISPSLPKLVGGGDAPLVIGLRPTEPPDISIGKGTLAKDAKGNDIVKDPLIDIKIPNMGFDFMVFLHDRWTRLFTYKVDIVLPLGLAVKPGNKLGLVLGDLGTAMVNPRVEQSYMVAEKNDKLANGLFNLLKAVLPLATGSLGNQEFDLPDIQGLKLTIRGITGQKPRGDRPDRFEFLTLFADLGLAATNKPLLPKTPIGMKLVRMDIPPNMVSQLTQRVRLQNFPAAVIELDDFRSDREYSFKLNSSMWTPYKQGKQIRLENPQFLIQGTHTLYVRSRSIDKPSADDNAFGVFSFRVDYTAPQLTLKATEDGLMPQVKDNLTKAAEVAVEYRVDGASWVPLVAGDSIPTQGLAAGSKIEVRAKDANGNYKLTSFTTKADEPTLTNAPTHTVAPAVTPTKQVAPAGPTNPAMSGCQMGEAPSPDVPFFAMFLLLGMAIWSRRSRKQ